MTSSIYAIISVVVASLISLIGAFTLRFNITTLKKASNIILGFAVGAMLGDVFLHILPEVRAAGGKSIVISALPLVGILLFFSIEKLLRWHHSHTLEPEKGTNPIAAISIAGDAIHNLIDGLIIGASYLVSFPLGLATTIAIILHEIPQEIGDFGILIHSGMRADRALFFNFLSSLAAVAGTIVALGIGTQAEDFTVYLLPIAAGGFIYIAGSDLVPELHQQVRLKHSLFQLISVILGIAAMAALLLL